MNRFNYGSQATQAVSLVGGLVTAGSQLTETAKNTKKTAETTAKTAESTKATAENTKATSHKMSKLDKYFAVTEKVQDSVDEYKAKSSQPTLDTNGLLDLFNNDAAETDNTEVE